MKRKRFSQEKMIRILKEGEVGVKTADLCRKYGMSEATFYNWKSKYGGMSYKRGQAPENAWEGEQQVKTDRSRSNPGQRSASRGALKKLLKPRAKIKAVRFLLERFGRKSQRRACGLIGISRNTLRYVSTKKDNDKALRKQMRQLAERRRRFGAPRIHVLLE